MAYFKTRPVPCCKKPWTFFFFRSKGNRLPSYMNMTTWMHFHWMYPSSVVFSFSVFQFAILEYCFCLFSLSLLFFLPLKHFFLFLKFLSRFLSPLLFHYSTITSNTFLHDSGAFKRPWWCLLYELYPPRHANSESAFGQKKKCVGSSEEAFDQPSERESRGF